MKECVTHSFACDCREEKFRKMEKDIEKYIAALKKIENHRKDINLALKCPTCASVEIAQEALGDLASNHYP